jgi:hypothetical protein
MPLRKSWQALLFLFCCLAITPAVTQTVPATFFNLHMGSGVTYNEPWPQVDFRGFRLLGTNTNWAQLNPQPGVYDWTMLDRWLSTMSAHGISSTDVIYTFIETPRWASSDPNLSTCAFTPGACAPPLDLNPDGTGTNQIWKDFVTALVNHVQGRIKNWEVWNEAQWAPYFSGTPAQLVRMAKDLRAIAQAADPEAKILSPAGSDMHVKLSNACWAAKNMDQYFAAGLGPYIDIVNFHAYFAPPGGLDVPENLVLEVGCIRTMMANRGQQNKPLWASEGSWGHSVSLSNLDQQAGYVARAYLLLWSLGVQRYYWYRWDSSDIGVLWQTTTGIDKAGIAYGQVAKWMIGATLVSPCSESSGSVWTCNFKLANGAPAQAVWSLNSLQYTAPSHYTKYWNVAGTETVVPSNHIITIGYKPIFLE